MTIPGVGAVTALAYRATIDVPPRFRNSKAVGAVLGLTPAQHQSGEMSRVGRISLCGDGMMRALLYEGAQTVITGRPRRGSQVPGFRSVTQAHIF